MRVDYHTHHYRCGHAEGLMDEYVEAAIAADLDEIGLSDHSPIYHLSDDPHPRPYVAMSQHELPQYVDQMLAVKHRYADRITVRLGVESDYIMGWDAHYRNLWQRYPLDYVIGSVHWLDRWSIFNEERPAGQDAQDIYDQYLYTTQAAARSGAYDILGHLDCLKTHGHIPDMRITPLLEETIRVLAACDLTVELNTSGWRKPIGACYPRAELLERCHHYGVPVTLASDAHTPQDVASGFSAAVQLLKDIGYRQIATYTQRKRQMVPLDD